MAAPKVFGQCNVQFISKYLWDGRVPVDVRQQFGPRKPPRDQPPCRKVACPHAHADLAACRPPAPAPRAPVPVRAARRHAPRAILLLLPLRARVGRGGG